METSKIVEHYCVYISICFFYSFPVGMWWLRRDFTMKLY